ncbi:MAG TPA: hypothetical protein VNT26_09895, partial [Candidatus Sulfotelmatobacter sp.]|nr:hypothetical protein [Candidatus Sulfotelmatobacter sp.]
IQKLVRLHLGQPGRWPWPVQLGLPLLLIAGLWMALHPLLVHLHVINPVRSQVHLAEQGALVAIGVLLSLKFLLPVLLLLHLVTSYVYLGSSPLWDFIANTARNLLAPLQRLPLRFAKLDLTPLVGVMLIFLLLHWLPNFVLFQLAQKRLMLWPQ